MTVIKVTTFVTRHKQHSIALPVKAIGKNHLSVGAEFDTIEVNSAHHGVAEFEINLTFVGMGKCMGFPERHVLSLAHDAPEQRSNRTSTHPECDADTLLSL